MSSWGTVCLPGERWWQVGTGGDEQKQWVARAALKEALSSMVERLARREKSSLEAQEIINEDLNYDAHSENEMEIMVGIKRRWVE